MKQLNLVEMTQEDTRLFNILFEENSSVYTEMIDHLSRKWKGNLYWWATSLASRNPWLSAAFKEICLVLLAIQKAEQDAEICEIIVPCEEIKCVLFKYFQDRDREVAIFADKNAARFDDVTFISQFARNLLIKEYVEKTWSVPEAVQSGSRIVLADSEILASHVRKGIYRDRLFDPIEELADKKIVFLPLLVDDIMSDQKGLIKKIRKHRSQNTVLKEHFLKRQDYLKLLPIPFWNRCFCRGKKYFDGIDVTPIINGDLKRTMSSAQTQECVLKYLLIRRMRQRKIEIETLVGWYEGQPSSVGLFTAYNKLYKEGKSIGYIGFAMDANWISLAPSKEQIRQKAAPRQIGVIGGIFLNSPKRFCRETATILFPAFRIKAGKNDCYAGRKNRILVALSYEEATSARILKMIKGIDTWLKEKGIKVYIKNHPQLSTRTLSDYGINELACEHVFLDQSFQEAIERADVVITAKSTTSYETVMYGKKVIVLGMAGDITFTYMPREWEGKRYGVAYNEEELVQLITCFNEREIKKLDLSREYLVRPRKEELINIL